MNLPPRNLLVIMDDEHDKRRIGCYGAQSAHTPHLDRLAHGGTRFTSAYTNSPICVPARACFATGRHVHETGFWDNAIAYDGSVPSWGHALQAAGVECVSIGKLHYVDDRASTGFDRQILPMHIEEGVGDLFGLVRDPPPARPQCRDLAERIGPGETSYIRYDRDITSQTCDWLRERGASRNAAPWVLFCSYISPHSPLVAPPEDFALHPLSGIAPIKRRAAGFSHPWWDAFNDCYTFDRWFADDHARFTAIASAMGLGTFVDRNVGRVLAALEAAGLADSTRIAFVSDHGANLGARGLWGKSNMYEESAGVPLILAGPEVPAGAVCKTPVSLIDFFPTILDGCGVSPGDGRAGESLWDIARAADRGERTVLSEYHAAGGLSAVYMLRSGDFKYIHYTGFRPELFNLVQDPQELNDLAQDAGHAPLLDQFESRLRAMLDPEAVDRQAKADQQRLIDRHGGRASILARGSTSYTPAPGEKAELFKN